MATNVNNPDLLQVTPILVESISTPAALPVGTPLNDLGSTSANNTRAAGLVYQYDGTVPQANLPNQTVWSQVITLGVGVARVTTNTNITPGNLVTPDGLGGIRLALATEVALGESLDTYNGVAGIASATNPFYVRVRLRG